MSPEDEGRGEGRGAAVDDDEGALRLPDLFEGTLDEAGVVALFDTLRHHVGPAAVDVQVRQRAMVAVAPKPQEGPSDPAAALDAAQAAVLGQPPRAVQLRYRWEGGVWCDTLLPAPGGGVRVVRVRQDQDA